MPAVLDAPAVPDAAPAAAPAAGFPAVDLRLVQLVVENAAAVGDDTPNDTGDGASKDAGADAMLIDQIGLLESIQHTLAALQATLTRRFARRHVAARLAAGETDPEELERSVAAQVGLACRVSPTRARQRVRAARDLHDGLDHVRARFAAGDLGPAAVAAIVRATRDLTREQRSESTGASPPTT